MRITGLLILLALLTACGMKGDLYFPGEPDPATAPETEDEEPAEEAGQPRP